MPTFTGTGGPDALVGTNDADLIEGLDGNDTISGGFGADTLIGGAGDDVFQFTGVMTTNQFLRSGLIDGGPGRDVVDASNVSPTGLQTGQNTVSLTVGSQSFTLIGIEQVNLGPGNDYVNLAFIETTITVSTGAGNDQFFGNSAVNFIDAGSGDDRLNIRLEDFAAGGEGNDFFTISGPSRPQTYTGGSIDGGPGIDTASLDFYVSIDLSLGRLTFAQPFTNSDPNAFMAVSGIEDIVFSTSNLNNPSIIGSEGNNVITGFTQFGVAGRAVVDGRGGNDSITGASGNDEIRGGFGDDTISGGMGDDLVDGGVGFDTFVMTASGVVDLRVIAAQETGSGRDTLISIEDVIGSDGSDVITGNVFANRLEGGAASDRIDGRAGSDTILGGASGDILNGGGGQDSILGGDGNDTLSGGVGSDIIEGGAGQDTLLLSGVATDYSVSRLGSSWVIKAFGDTDIVTGVEFVSVGTQTLTLAQFELTAFDPYSYLAANPDIYAAFGLNAAAAQSHYFTNGAAENRSTGDFDALTYIASNRDLIQAFGANAQAGFAHYMGAGRFEGRATDSFDALEYLAKNKDLADAFGLDVVAAIRHYIGAGAAEGRATTFDGDLYAASNADLSAAFGTDERASLSHFILAGRAEGRATDTFNFAGYQARNPDLVGLSRDALVDHWLAVGQDEGRSVSAVSSAALGLERDSAGKPTDPYVSAAEGEAGWTPVLTTTGPSPGEWGDT